MNQENQIEITWQNDLEDLLSDLGEKCAGYSFLHSKAEGKYAKINNQLSIPVIVLSTLTGATSVGSATMFGENPYASIIIGLVSITTGIIQTISSYFKYAQRSESHRLTAISYKKLNQFLTIELSLPRNQRMPPKAMLKYVRTELTRLLETAPQIPDEIINLFKEKYKNETASKPDETNGIEEIKVNRTEIKKATFEEIIGRLKNHENSPLNSPTNYLAVNVDRPQYGIGKVMSFNSIPSQD